MITLAICGLKSNYSSAVTETLARAGLIHSEAINSAISSTIEEWHERVIEASPVHKGDLQPAKVWQMAAAQIIEANAKSDVWGWYSPHTHMLMKFWSSFDYRINFLLISTSFSEFLSSADLHGIDVTRYNLLAERWENYEKTIVQFSQEHPTRSLIVRPSSSHCSPERLFSDLAENLGIKSDGLKLKTQTQEFPVGDSIIKSILRGDSLVRNASPEHMSFTCNAVDLETVASIDQVLRIRHEIAEQTDYIKKQTAKISSQKAELDAASLALDEYKRQAQNLSTTVEQMHERLQQMEAYQCELRARNHALNQIAEGAIIARKKAMVQQRLLNAELELTLGQALSGQEIEISLLQEFQEKQKLQAELKRHLHIALEQEAEHLAKLESSNARIETLTKELSASRAENDSAIANTPPSGLERSADKFPISARAEYVDLGASENSQPDSPFGAAIAAVTRVANAEAHTALTSLHETQETLSAVQNDFLEINRTLKSERRKSNLRNAALELSLKPIAVDFKCHRVANSAHAADWEIKDLFVSGIIIPKIEVKSVVIGGNPLLLVKAAEIADLIDLKNELGAPCDTLLVAPNNKDLDPTGQNQKFLLKASTTTWRLLMRILNLLKLKLEDHEPSETSLSEEVRQFWNLRLDILQSHLVPYERVLRLDRVEKAGDGYLAKSPGIESFELVNVSYGDLYWPALDISVSSKGPISVDLCNTEAPYKLIQKLGPSGAYVMEQVETPDELAQLISARLGKDD